MNHSEGWETIIKLSLIAAALAILFNLIKGV